MHIWQGRFCHKDLVDLWLFMCFISDCKGIAHLWLCAHPGQTTRSSPSICVTFQAEQCCCRETFEAKSISFCLVAFLWELWFKEDKGKELGLTCTLGNWGWVESDNLVFVFTRRGCTSSSASDPSELIESNNLVFVIARRGCTSSSASDPSELM